MNESQLTVVLAPIAVQRSPSVSIVFAETNFMGLNMFRAHYGAWSLQILIFGAAVKLENDETAVATTCGCPTCRCVCPIHVRCPFEVCPACM